MATRTMPEELLQQIFLENIDNVYAFEPRRRFVLADEQMRVRTLMNICLASKPCHRIAAPLLYKKFMHYPEPSRLLHREQRTILFLKSILANPQNALELEHLKVPFWATFGDVRDGSADFCDLMVDRALLPAQRSHFAWVAEQLHLHGRCGENIGNALKIEWEGAVLAMLLLLCPNISKLELLLPDTTCRAGVFLRAIPSAPHGSVRFALDAGGQDRDIGPPSSSAKDRTVVLSSKWQPPILRGLTEATLVEAGNGNNAEKWMRSIISLPSISKLRVGRLAGRFRFAPKIPHIRSLQLDDCKMSIIDLECLLRMCPSLSTLKIGWHPKFRQAILPIDSPLLAFINFLSKRAPALTKLTVKNNCRPPQNPDGSFRWNVGENIRTLGHLTSLSVREPSLWGYDTDAGIFDVLPPTLVDLKIARRRHDLPEDLAAAAYSEWTARHDVELRILALDPGFLNLRLITVSYERADHAPRIELDEQLKEHGWTVSVNAKPSGAGKLTLKRARQP